MIKHDLNPEPLFSPEEERLIEKNTLPNNKEHMLTEPFKKITGSNKHYRMVGAAGGGLAGYGITKLLTNKIKKDLDSGYESFKRGLTPRQKLLETELYLQGKKLSRYEKLVYIGGMVASTYTKMIPLPMMLIFGATFLITNMSEVMKETFSKNFLEKYEEFLSSLSPQQEAELEKLRNKSDRLQKLLVLGSLGGSVLGFIGGMYYEAGKLRDTAINTAVKIKTENPHMDDSRILAITKQIVSNYKDKNYEK